MSIEIYKSCALGQGLFLTYTGGSEDCANLVVPAYVTGVGVNYNINLKKIPLVADINIPGYFTFNRPQKQFAYNLEEEGGSFSLTGYIITSLVSDAETNIGDILRVIKGIEIASVTITSAQDSTKTITFREVTCNSFNLSVGSVGGQRVQAGSIGYIFAYI